MDRIEMVREAVTKAYINRNRYRDHRITYTKFGVLKTEQNNKCAICLKDQTYTTELYVDHCHKTKKIRGLLCHHCNTLLGFAKDNIDTLLRAVAYLKKFQ